LNCVEAKTQTDLEDNFGSRQRGTRKKTHAALPDIKKAPRNDDTRLHDIVWPDWRKTRSLTGIADIIDPNGH
jgi:hypothetical protein